jgi:plastocyanin
MVSFKAFVAVAALSGAASALPRPNPQDSSIGEEIAVSAPFGIPMSDTADIASQLSSEAAAELASATTSVDAATTAVSVDTALVTDTTAVSVDTALVTDTYDAAFSVQTDIASATSAHIPIETPAYGSGNAPWGGAGYDDCVNQCMASFGAPPSPVYAPTVTAGHEGPVGTGATHTVIVAPSQGVLRYIPFALNATVGDTIKFMWGANNHTVTKGTALTPCNRSEDEFSFASGLKNKDFVFTQVVNDTEPTYFYCAAPTHCQKGMFGIINPVASFGSPTSFGGMIPQLSANNSDVSAHVANSNKACEGHEQASKWGSNIDLGALPEWAHQYAAENVFYTRNFLAANEDTLKEDGAVDLSAASTNPMMIPQDIAASLNIAGSGDAAGSSSASASESAAQPTDSAAAATGGASSLASPRVLLGVVVVLATFFAL